MILNRMRFLNRLVPFLGSSLLLLTVQLHGTSLIELIDRQSNDRPIVVDSATALDRNVAPAETGSVERPQRSTLDTIMHYISSSVRADERIQISTIRSEQHMAIQDVIQNQFTDDSIVYNICEAVILTEVGPYIETLRSDPNISHGLLQPNPEWIRKFNRDTSHGWFGFTFGTMADTIDDANHKPKGSTLSFYDAHKSEIFALKDRLEASGYNVPIYQCILFYTRYMVLIAQFLDGPVSSRILSPEYTAIVNAEGAKHGFLTKDSTSKVAIATLFYKRWNGALDKSKIHRFISGLSQSAEKTSNFEAWNND